jgi:peroxiredoxin
MKRTDLRVEGQLDFFADPDGVFTSHIGQLTDLSAAGLGKRSKRYFSRGLSLSSMKDIVQTE